jgi:hypothetical protein
VGFGQRGEAGDVGEQEGCGGVGQRDSSLLLDVEDEHHAALVVLGDVAVGHL